MINVERVLDPAAPEIPEAVDLLTRCLGPAYSVAWLTSLVADAERAALFVVAEGATVVGTAAVTVSGRRDDIRLDRALARLRVAAADRVGLLRTMAVDPLVRGRGIGDALVGARVDYLRAEGCEEAYVASWVWGARQQSLRILERNGFEPLGEVPDYWNQPGDPPSPCAVCGSVCRCSAVIMRLRLAPAPADQEHGDDRHPAA